MSSWVYKEKNNRLCSLPHDKKKFHVGGASTTYHLFCHRGSLHSKEPLMAMSKGKWKSINSAGGLHAAQKGE